VPFRVLFVPTYRINWVPSIPPWPPHFWWTSRGVPPRPSPAKLLGKRDHPLVSFRAPSETIRLSPAVRAVFAATHVQHLPWGLIPLRDVSCRSPRPTGFPNPTFGPSSTFLTSSTVCSSDRLAGLFHPATTSRVSLQGFPPTDQERRLVAVASSLAVGTELLPACAGASSRRVDLEGLF
jgi:hypothetical protein